MSLLVKYCCCLWPPAWRPFSHELKQLKHFYASLFIATQIMQRHSPLWVGYWEAAICHQILELWMCPPQQHTPVLLCKSITEQHQTLQFIWSVSKLQAPESSKRHFIIWDIVQNTRFVWNWEIGYKMIVLSYSCSDKVVFHLAQLLKCRK